LRSPFGPLMPRRACLNETSKSAKEILVKPCATRTCGARKTSVPLFEPRLTVNSGLRRIVQSAGSQEQVERERSCLDKKIRRQSNRFRLSFIITFAHRLKSFSDEPSLIGRGFLCLADVVAQSRVKRQPVDQPTISRRCPIALLPDLRCIFAAYSERCRSPFRGDGDRDSELMPITIPR